MSRASHALLRLVALCSLSLTCVLPAQIAASGSGWPAYGGDAGGQRYSSARQVTRDNVTELHEVWRYHTGALATDNRNRAEAAFEATPILAGHSLYFSTPFDQVISVDAATGAERWRFDPRLAKDVTAGVYTSRGVAFWGSAAAARVNCGQRIFAATLDARLIALDAGTGAPCAGFGTGGTVDLRRGVPTQTAYPYQEFGNSSPPTVVGDVVVVGSAVADGQEVDVEPGVVRGFDARSGRLLWTWDPLPWARRQRVRTGAGNTWGVIAADLQRGIVYLPTGSPSPDFYGGMRPGDDRDADSVVALDARTGRKLWAFQVVHHDLWDYDVAAEPLLFEYQGAVPAVAVATKMGMIFVLNRVTGAPLYPVTERRVPPSDVPGEVASPTQPFSSLPPLSPLRLQPSDLQGHTLADAAVCSAKLAALRDDGIFTPPSLHGSLLYPGSLGGVNWGSAAFDPETGVLYVNSNHHAFRTRLVRRWLFTGDGIVDSWENWIYAAAALLLLLWVVRRSFLPRWVGGGVVLVLLLAGSWFWFARARGATALRQ